MRLVVGVLRVRMLLLSLAVVIVSACGAAEGSSPPDPKTPAEARAAVEHVFEATAACLRDRGWEARVDYEPGAVLYVDGVLTRELMEAHTIDEEACTRELLAAGEIIDIDDPPDAVIELDHLDAVAIQRCLTEHHYEARPLPSLEEAIVAGGVPSPYALESYDELGLDVFEVLEACPSYSGVGLD